MGSRSCCCTGSPRTVTLWDLVTPLLAAERRVISVDLPGFGCSAPAGEAFDLEQVAIRIARGLAAQGIRGPFDLVGHSLGGGVALTLAVLRPRAVRRLVLVAPGGLRPLPPRIAGILASAADAVIAARRASAPLTDLAWGRRLLLTGVVADGAALPPSLARQMVRASSTAIRTAPALRTIAAADLRPLLVETRAPLDVIWGEADQTTPVGTVAEPRTDPRGADRSRGRPGVRSRDDDRRRPRADRRGQRAGARNPSISSVSIRRQPAGSTLRAARVAANSSRMSTASASSLTVPSA